MMHAVADDAVFVDGDVRVENAIAPDLRARPDVCARVEGGALADRRRLMDVRRRMHAVMRVFAVPVQQHDRLHEGVVRIVRLQQRDVLRGHDRRRDDDGGGVGGIDLPRILRRWRENSPARFAHPRAYSRR